MSVETLNNEEFDFKRESRELQNEVLKPTLSVSNFHIANLKRCFQFIGNHQKVVSTPISTENIPYPLNKSIKINSNPLQNTS